MIHRLLRSQSWNYLLLVIAVCFCSTGNSTLAVEARQSEVDTGAVQKSLPMAYRNDGFSLYYATEPPMTRKYLEEHYIDPLANSNVQILLWGIGPGSVLTYNTKVGEIYGDRLGEEQWKMCRPQDRWVNANIHALIKEAGCPLKIVSERAHQLGMKAFGRFPVQREYGPPLDKWMAVAFTGEFTRKHPEYRIPGMVFLDFKHKAVRDFKLAILREAVEAGMEGLFLDYCIKPGPFTANSDCKVMTRFMRECRKMTEEIGQRENRKIGILVRVPSHGAKGIGLDWETWMREKLIDYLVPSFVGPLGPGRMGYQFFYPADRFLAVGKQTGCKVYGFIWHDLGLVSHDPAPDGKTRYAKLMNRQMFQAQALLHHRSGVDGIHLGWGWGDEWACRPWANDLSDPDKLEFADKHYMVDVGPNIPLNFTLPKKPKEGTYTAQAEVPLRIADDTAAALEKKYSVEAELVFHSRGLKKGESLAVYINGKGPVTVTGGSPAEAALREPVKWKTKGAGALIAAKSWIFEPDWWRRGEHRVHIKPEWLLNGENKIKFVYTATPDAVASGSVEPKLWISWIDLLINYDEPTNRLERITAGFSGEKATTPESIKQYTGERAAEHIVGTDRKAAYLLNYKQLEINYADNVEYQLRRQQVILCPQTVDYLYDKFTSLEVRYRRGLRPKLERVVDRLTAECKTQTDKALVLMRFCRDLYKKKSWHKKGFADYVYGGTEERMIEKGEQLCECLGRLYVALCEVAGIPGRIVMHDIGGHITAEVHVDGGWAYIDPRCGMYFRKPDGKLASTWELWTDPRLTRNQGDTVMYDVSPRWKWEYRQWKCEAKYFDPREVTGLQNYSLADFEKYNYETLSEKRVRDRGLYVINKEYRDKIDTVFGTSDAARDGKKRLESTHQH
ncbi:MAG: hypothetical protein JXM70_01205 [Pirellulales bacterium]|nr:hypothetical protein [Pirellulales bacterium]